MSEKEDHVVSEVLRSRLVLLPGQLVDGTLQGLVIVTTGSARGDDRGNGIRLQVHAPGLSRIEDLRHALCLKLEALLRDLASSVTLKGEQIVFEAKPKPYLGDRTVNIVLQAASTILAVSALSERRFVHGVLGGQRLVLVDYDREDGIDGVGLCFPARLKIVNEGPDPDSLRRYLGDTVRRYSWVTGVDIGRGGGVHRVFLTFRPETGLKQGDYRELIACVIRAIASQTLVPAGCRELVFALSQPYFLED